MKYAKVKLHGGPDDGKWIDYGVPLPKVLVVPHVKDTKDNHAVIAWNDYMRRKPGGVDYDYIEPKEVVAE